jgi:hypothetical protein
VFRYAVRDPKSMIHSWKFWNLSRVHASVYHELRHGNNGKGWTVMEVAREGINKNTRYKVKGVR